MSRAPRSPLAWSAKRILTIGAAVLIPLAFVGLGTAALADADAGVSRIPAAIVNKDRMVTTTGADGEEQVVLAGRLLVTELTGPDSPGFDWIVTNDEDAEAALAAGEVHAVLTIPEDFSRSVVSLAGEAPQRAQLSLRTDDAHDYLSGAITEATADGMAAAFGQQLTTQYLEGVYAGLGDLGQSLSTAATAAGDLAGGAAGLRDGLAGLSTGLTEYTGGVQSLSSGLDRLEDGAASLDQLSAGVDQYTGGVSELSAALSGAVAQLAADPGNAQALGTVQFLTSQLSETAAQGDTLAGSTQRGVDGVQAGIAQSAAGASRLAASSGALTDGAQAAAGGATEISTGATTLADGLAAGSAQVPTPAEGALAFAEVVAAPVALSVDRDNPVDTIGQAAASGLIPIALWIGALVVTLVSRPLPTRALLSTASTARLVGRRLGWSFLITGSQAMLLTALLHTALGVSFSALGAALGFTLLTAFAFAALHTLLGTAGRAVTLLVSVFLLAVQLAAAGGVLPAPVLADPFATLSQYLPVGWAQSGLLSILAGTGISDAVGATVALAGLALVSAVLMLLAMARRRRLAALGLSPNLAAAGTWNHA